MIELNHSYYLAKGGSKVVYRHPADPGICIKFPKEGKKHALSSIQSEIRFLNKHRKDLPWIAAYLGTIKTNLGTGYAYELVRDADGSLSESLSPSICESIEPKVKGKIATMYRQLIDAHAVVNDLKLKNILFKRTKDDDFDLILVDGFGNDNYIKIADYSKYFLIRKLNRKFGRLCKSLELSQDFFV